MFDKNIVKYFLIILLTLFFNNYYIYSCGKIIACCKKCCKGDNKELSEQEKGEMKDFLFGVCFHSEDLNFVFHDYINVTKLTDKNILKLIGKNESNDVYVLNINIDDKTAFSDDNKELDDKYYKSSITKGREYLKISKKKYEEDKKNNKYNYLRDGRIDSKKYGTVIYYIESGKLCIYCKDSKKKLFGKENKKKMNFYYEGYKGSQNESDYDVINYFDNNNKIIKKEEQLSPFVYIESSVKNKLVLTFYKKKQN